MLESHEDKVKWDPETLETVRKHFLAAKVVLLIPPFLMALVLLGFHYIKRNLSYNNISWVKIGLFNLFTHIENIDDFCCHIVSKENRSLT